MERKKVRARSLEAKALHRYWRRLKPTLQPTTRIINEEGGNTRDPETRSMSFIKNDLFNGFHAAYFTDFLFDLFVEINTPAAVNMEHR